MFLSNLLLCPLAEQAFACKSPSTPVAYSDIPFQGHTACATLRPVAPLLRFSKKILLTFRHGA